MKILSIVLAILISCIGLHAQGDTTDYIDIGTDYRESPLETFHKGSTHHGWLVGLTAHYGQIESENAAFGGVKLAYIMNHSLEAGFAGVSFYSQLKNDDLDNGEVDIAGGYGGLHLAPVIRPIKKVHIAFPIMLGAGAVGYDEWNRRPGNSGFEFNDDWDEIFIAQVGANVVFNITKFFQVELGVNYLKTTDIELDKINNLSIDGFTGGFGFRFGRF